MAEELGRRSRDEDLPAVRGGADAGRAVHLEADVVVRRALCLTRVDSDARPDDRAVRPLDLVERALEGDGRSRRLVDDGEDAERPVPLGVDNDAAAPLDDPREGRLEAPDDVGVRARELLRDASRALHVHEHERHCSVRERPPLGASVEALGEEHGEVVEDELGELARRAERPVRDQRVAPDPVEKAVELGVALGRRLLDVDQLRTPATSLELVLEAGNRGVRTDPAVALPVDPDEDVALLEVRAVHVGGAVGARSELEAHGREAQRSDGRLDGIPLGRELAERRGDEDAQPLIGREDGRRGFGHACSLNGLCGASAWRFAHATAPGTGWP